MDAKCWGEPKSFGPIFAAGLPNVTHNAEHLIQIEAETQNLMIAVEAIKFNLLELGH
jgi:hypothetical protein